jgi:anthranilate synthase component 2
VVNPDTISEEIVVTSVDTDGRIMSLRHIEFDVKGIQFHPESILTPFGKTILKNWLINS